MRLIDADVFVEDLDTEALNLAMDGLKGTPRPRQHLYEIIDRINEQPTAYDIDKVVEELEKLADESYKAYCIDFYPYDRAKYDAYTNAIEIVNKGGVEKDVCEWRYNDTEYCLESSCNHLQIFMDDCPKQNEYSFCPYCGKKIKVVE